MIDDQPYPQIGEWYCDGADRLFKVVALNDADESIEIQFQDGNLEELDTDIWHEMGVEATDEPEDWSQPFDDLEADDIEESDSATRLGSRNPMDGLDY